ncbi:MAG TPA: hypothetical protein PLO15_11565, partial [Propionicimonas sp.]|nr:hypothetical protein [Propionicimonas sp.]
IPAPAVIPAKAGIPKRDEPVDTPPWIDAETVPVEPREPASEASRSAVLRSPASDEPGVTKEAADAGYPPARPAESARPAETPGVLGTTDVRRFWPQILDNVKNRRRFTWILLSQNAQVVEVREGVLTLGLNNAGAREGFARGGNADVLREAILEVLGAALHIDPIVDANATPSPASSPAREAAPGPSVPPSSPASPPRSAAAEAARANLRPTRSAAAIAAEDPEPEPNRDDEVVDESSTSSSEDLLMKHLGAELVAEDEN